MIYCRKCGTKNQEGATYCAKCGEKLPQPAQQVKPAQKQSGAKHWQKPVLIIAAILLVLLAGYGNGKARYAKDKQIAEIVSRMKDPNKDLSPYVKTDDSSFKLTKESVEPLQEYYKANPTKANNLGSEWKREDDFDDVFEDAVSLGEDGRCPVIFDGGVRRPRLTRL